MVLVLFLHLLRAKKNIVKRVVKNEWIKITFKLHLALKYKIPHLSEVQVYIWSNDRCFNFFQWKIGKMMYLERQIISKHGWLPGISRNRNYSNHSADINKRKYKKWVRNSATNSPEEFYNWVNSEFSVWINNTNTKILFAG